MAKELHFKAARGGWFSLCPPFLLFAAPAALYFSGMFGSRDALLLGFSVLWFAIGVVLLGMRCLYLARYRLSLGIDRQARRLTIRERRLRTREHVVDATMVSSLRLVVPASSGSRVHLELNLQGERVPLGFGWELGRSGNVRVFSLLRRLWRMVETESNWYVLLRNPHSMSRRCLLRIPTNKKRQPCELPPCQ